MAATGLSMCIFLSSEPILTLPQPSILYNRVTTVNAMFKAADKDGTLFGPDFDKVFGNAMDHIRQGCLSDSPDVNLYTDITRADGQVVRYTCSRVCGENLHDATAMMP
jgi:hypothetical protein